MPIIHILNSIKIKIYFLDHAPPHFHAEYNEYEEVFVIRSLKTLAGNLPTKQRRRVIKWAKANQEELLAVWNEYNPNHIDLKGFKSPPRIVSVKALDGFQLSLLFNNGHYRLVKLPELFNDVFKMKPGFFAYSIIEDANVFEQVVVDGHSISWPNITCKRKNFSGEELEVAFDLDPAVLYANSVPD